MTGIDASDAAARAQLERELDNMQRRWVQAVKNQSCEKAARDVHAQRGEALMLWIDHNGEMQARRICPETSTIRDFVPDYLRRK